MLSRSHIKSLIIAVLLSSPAVQAVTVEQSSTELWIQQNAKHLNTILFTLIGSIQYADEAVLCKLLGATDADPEFTDFVKREMQASGLDTQKLYVKVSLFHNAVGGAQGLTHGIIIGKTIQDQFKAKQADLDSLRFLIRHEASHVKHKDVVKNTMLRLMLHLTLYYGADYMLDILEQNGCLPAWYLRFTKACPWAIKFMAKSYAVSILASLYSVSQERRADKEAAADKALAQGGIRMFERFKAAEKNVHPWMQKLNEFANNNPSIYHALMMHPTHQERIDMLQKVA